MTNEEFLQAINNIKDDVVARVMDSLGKITVSEYHLVQDYMKRAQSDFHKEYKKDLEAFKAEYDNRLKNVENEQRIIKAGMWPWWVVGAGSAIIILALIAVIIK
jgi:hypothetical protein